MPELEDIIKLNNTTILLEIEDIVESQHLNYIDAIILWCENHNIEVESIAGIIKTNHKFRNKVKKNAESLNFLPKTKRLPLE